MQRKAASMSFWQSWLHPISKLEPERALMKLKKCAQRIRLHLNLCSFRVYVSQQIHSSRSVGITHDGKVLPGAVAHLRKRLLDDLLFAGVSLRCGIDFGRCSQRHLLELGLGYLDICCRALYFTLIAIPEWKLDLQTSVESVGARVAFIPTEDINVGHTKRFLQLDIRLRCGNRLPGNHYVRTPGKHFRELFVGNGVDRIDGIAELDISFEGMADLPAELDPGEGGVPLCGLKGDEEPVALDLHPEQIGAAHCPSVDTLLVIANHLVNCGQILSK